MQKIDIFVKYCMKYSQYKFVLKQIFIRMNFFEFVQFDLFFHGKEQLF